MIRFQCPSCGLDVSAPDDCAGRRSKCRRCHGPIVVPPAAAPFHFSCPHCQTVLRASEHFLGRSVPCPKCQQTFTIAGSVQMPASTPAPNRLDEVEKVEGKPYPFVASSSPSVLGFAEIPDPKPSQETPPPVAPIINDSINRSAKHWPQSSGNGTGRTGHNLYLFWLLSKWKVASWKTRVVFLGTVVLIISLLAFLPGAACFGTVALIIGLSVRKTAPAGKGSLMAFLGTAALIIGLFSFRSGWDSRRVDELFELSLPRDTIDALYPEEQRSRFEAMAFGTVLVLAGLVLLLLSRLFRPSNVLGTASLAFGIITVLHYWNLKTVFWTGIGGRLYHDHAREHEQLVGVIAGIGWIIASLLFLLWVRLLQALNKNQAGPK